MFLFKADCKYLFQDTEVSGSLYTQSQSMGSNPELMSNQIRIKEETSSVPILPQPPPATLIIPAQVNISAIQPSTSDPVCIIYRVRFSVCMLRVF